MNLRHLTDECLILETKRLVQRERDLLITLLHHLREMERRRLFGDHPTLHVYAVKELGYPDDQAHRRVAAMKLFQDMPEIEEKIESGKINLTHIGMASSHFKNQKKHGKPLSKQKKLDLIEAMAGTSTREAQRTIASLATVPPAFRESIRPLGGGRNAITMSCSDETLAKIERLRGLLAHVDPNLSIGDLVDRLCDIGIEKLDPARPSSRKAKVDSPAEVRRAVWLRDGGACTKCKSRFALEEDHIVPKSMGGGYTIENVRLLCRTCNQRAAIEKLGLQKMEPFLENRGAAGDFIVRF